MTEEPNKIQSVENFSWASLIENELSGSINDQFLNGSLNAEIDKKDKNMGNDNITLGEIMSIDCKSICERKLLDYQNIIANNLKKYIKQCMENNEKIDLNLHKNKFEWLSDANKYLSKKLKLPDIPIKMSGNEIIARSSYKFCEYSYDCEFNYSKNLTSQNKNQKKTRGCYKQHFVYNFLKTDIDSIVLYLEKTQNNGGEINYEELNKCMNTICYVINKMKDELENLHFRYGSEFKKYHMEKSTNFQATKKICLN